MSDFQESAAKLIKQRQRLVMLLNRFVTAEDERLTDVQFIDEVNHRWQRSRAEYLVDPNE